MNKVLFAIVLLYASVDNAEPSREYHYSNKNDWDMLTFTQEWPETVCREWVHHDPSHTCNMPKKTDSWSIHGLWPDKLHTRGPEFCNRSWHFDPEQIRPIETQLIDSWTNVEADTEKYSFWAHEWAKHGTCAASLETLNSEFKYFSMGLNLSQKYNIGALLAKIGIVPDDNVQYSIHDIYNGLKNILQVNPSVQCRKIDGKSFLVEVRICLEKNFEPRDCNSLTMMPKILNMITNCDATQGIHYPHNKWPMNKLYLELYKTVSWLQWFTL